MENLEKASLNITDVLKAGVAIDKLLDCSGIPHKKTYSLDLNRKRMLKAVLPWHKKALEIRRQFGNSFIQKDFEKALSEASANFDVDLEYEIVEVDRQLEQALRGISGNDQLALAFMLKEISPLVVAQIVPGEHGRTI
jgi:hypothetical protein